MIVYICESAIANMIEVELSVAEKIKFVQDTLYTISGKWKLPILMAMYGGATRFTDIQRSVSAITTKVLSAELKDLEEHLLILRDVDETYPVSISYSLTPYAFTLTPMVDEMISWGRNHRIKIAEK
jgi:DNA-binding HxlR family transcriptional regulator